MMVKNCIECLHAFMLSYTLHAKEGQAITIHSIILALDDLLNEFFTHLLGELGPC